ncbi:MAG: hypothetical protein ACI4E2_06940 [Acetatifactor sp.]
MPSFIFDDCSSHLDLGGGDMHIRHFLKQNVKYYGCDYIKRGSETIVCALSKVEFPNITVDTVFAVGLFEYLNNWKGVLEEITTHCMQLVMCYSIVQAAPQRDSLWINVIKEDEIIELLLQLDNILSGEKDTIPWIFLLLLNQVIEKLDKLVLKKNG